MGCGCQRPSFLTLARPVLQSPPLPPPPPLAVQVGLRVPAPGVQATLLVLRGLGWGRSCLVSGWTCAGHRAPLRTWRSGSRRSSGAAWSWMGGSGDGRSPVRSPGLRRKFLYPLGLGPGRLGLRSRRARLGPGCRWRRTRDGMLGLGCGEGRTQEGCRRGRVMWGRGRGQARGACGKPLCRGRAGVACPAGPGPRGVGAVGRLPSGLLPPCLSVAL